MGSPTPFLATRMGDYVIDRDLDKQDAERMLQDDLETEARNAVTYQDFLEEMAELKPSEQTAIVNALLKGDKLSRWVLEVITGCAFERAVAAKAKELK